MKISLKAARVNAELQQQEVAGKIGVAKATLRNWEDGSTSIPVEKFMKLCEMYGVKVEDISVG